jgi:hypothetical protein
MLPSGFVHYMRSKFEATDGWMDGYLNGGSEYDFVLTSSKTHCSWQKGLGKVK